MLSRRHHGQRCTAWDRTRVGPLSRVPGHVGVVVAWVVSWLLLMGGPAAALQPITISGDGPKIEITALGELYGDRGDTLQVETAAGADGAVGRMSVRATAQGSNPNWIVFALTNATSKPVERWLTADRYSLIGSGAIWPDLDAKRLEAVTPSFGFVPERIESDRADIFRLTLEPGQTITYVAELSPERFARIYLWKPLDYELKVRDRLLFNGVLLGLTGLLAVFLTAIFAANHKFVFPAAALVAWCALIYLCVDFGFFHKLFNMKPQDNAVYRAASEASLAASLVIFLHVFLRLALWHGLVRMLITVWIVAQLALVAIAVIDPRLASTFARLSFLAIGGIGAALTAYLAVRGQDRALSLVPTWMLLLVWLFASGVVLTGRLSGDMVVSGLVAGMVLILLLIGFTVTQYAFRSIEPSYGAAPSELQLRALALESSGAAVWEWSNRRDEVKTGLEVEQSLGLSPGELSCKVDEFCRHVHPADREKFRMMLWTIQERADGRMRTDFRMRHADNSYRWFEIEAARVPGSDPRSVKCAGLMRDITHVRRAHERLVHNAVHCSLTGLPNRELLLDRLGVLMQRAKSEQAVRPQALCIGLDKFDETNGKLGPVVGDSLLLTVARRLQRHAGEPDTLARTGSDEFTLLVPSAQNANEIAALAERIRRSLRSPIKIAGEEIVLTGSVGISIYAGDAANGSDLIKDAEIAMHRAKRSGADRVEVFKPEMSADREERRATEAELRRAIEKNQIKIFYQPLVYLPTEELAGFEAYARFEHPKFGSIDPTAFEPDDPASDVIARLAHHILVRATRDAAEWQSLLPRSEAKVFVTINVAGRNMLRTDVLQEVRQVLGRNIVPKGLLKLEIAEATVMQNPEQAIELLEQVHNTGGEIILAEFGAGMSSFAYLNRVPFDALKLDRERVRDAGAGDGSGATMVRAVVAMARELGKKIVIEGVESADDAATLRAVGCEYAGGPYFGGAHTEGEVVQLLKSIRRTERKLQPKSIFKGKAKATKSAKNGNAAKAASAATASAAAQNGADAAYPLAAGNAIAAEAPIDTAWPAEMAPPLMPDATQNPLPGTEATSGLPPQHPYAAAARMPDGPAHTNREPPMSPQPAMPPPVPASQPAASLPADAATGPTFGLEPLPPHPFAAEPGPAPQPQPPMIQPQMPQAAMPQAPIPPPPAPNLMPGATANMPPNMAPAMPPMLPEHPQPPMAATAAHPTAPGPAPMPYPMAPPMAQMSPPPVAMAADGPPPVSMHALAEAAALAAPAAEPMAHAQQPPPPTMPAPQNGYAPAMAAPNLVAVPTDATEPTQPTRPPVKQPEFTGLPPSIAASLARLAGKPQPKRETPG